ncbi:MAG: NUDIX domain-containing protein [Caulobacteraceae bacterium]
MAEPAKILNVSTLHDGWSQFLIAEVRVADGAVVTRQIEDHGDAVGVLPYDADAKTVVLVSLLRPPALYASDVHDLIEAVAGVIDDGESADVAARREALEEAGLKLGDLEEVGRFWTSPGVSTERMTLFLAPFDPADRLTRGGGLAVEHEGITVLELSAAEAWRRLETGEIADMKTLALLSALKLRHPDIFQP